MSGWMTAGWMSVGWIGAPAVSLTAEVPAQATTTAVTFVRSSSGEIATITQFSAVGTTAQAARAQAQGAAIHAASAGATFGSRAASRATALAAATAGATIPGRAVATGATSQAASAQAGLQARAAVRGSANQATTAQAAATARAGASGVVTVPTSAAAAMEAFAETPGEQIGVVGFPAAAAAALTGRVVASGLVLPSPATAAQTTSASAAPARAIMQVTGQAGVMPSEAAGRLASMLGSGVAAMQFSEEISPNSVVIVAAQADMTTSFSSGFTAVSTQIEMEAAMLATVLAAASGSIMAPATHQMEISGPTDHAAFMETSGIATATFIADPGWLGTYLTAAYFGEDFTV